MPSVQHSNIQPPNQYFSQLDMAEQDQKNYQQQLNCTSAENYLRSASNEKNIAMSNDRNFVKRGDLHGPIFEVDHLATFTVGSKQGLLKAEDGMRKLRIMEKSQGIWTMECQIIIDSNYLVVLDKKTGQEVEKFLLGLIHDPVSVVSDDKKDIYNNIILFTVLEDNRKKNASTPSEMHIFQCNKSHSAEIVDEIYKAKEGNQPKQMNDDNNYTKNLKLASNFASGHHMHSPSRRATFTQRDHQVGPTRIEMEVQVLNHCFDDIERFVTRLQNSTEFYKELEKRQKHRKSHKKHHGDGMLGLRAQMPAPQQYIDIFQKFKHSFNLLAKLKAHIHDPNAPELIHFLFTPLSLIVNTTKEQPYRGLSKTVWNPLLTRDAKDLLLNCLTSKEQDLWLLLGDAWSVTVEEAQQHPQQYGHLDNQTYNPVFSDGWVPNFNDAGNEFTKLAFATAAQVSKQPVPIQKQRYYSNTQPQFTDDHQRSQYRIQNQYESNPPSARHPHIRNYEAMKKWAVDLSYRGAKIYEVTHDRQANNDKELTIKVGELLEVLDDKRNWWRLRNFQGEVGHAPVTILRPYEFNNNTSNTNYMVSNSGHYDAEKLTEYDNKIGNLQLSQLSPETCSSSSSSFSSENNLNNTDNKNNNTSSVLSPNISSYLNSKTYLINRDETGDLSTTENKNSFNQDTSGESYSHHNQRYSHNQSHNQYSKVFEASNVNSSNELSKNYLISSTHNSSSLVYSSNTSSENNQTSIVATPKASYPYNDNKNYLQNQSVNEKPVLTLNEQIKQNPARFLRKTSVENVKPQPKKTAISQAEIAPIKDLLHDEIVKRMSKKDILKKTSANDIKRAEIYISVQSTPSEVKAFLISKDFSQKVILMFSELTGEQLFTLDKSDFESYFGKEEGTHLDSQIKVQKSLSGYEEQPTNELDNILKRRKEKSESNLKK